MEVAVVPATESDKEVLQRLMQLYLYEFSAKEGTEVNAHGAYPYRWLDNYWMEEGRHPFLIRVDGNWAGFVLVNQHTLVASAPARSIAEFFVMRKYRRKGVGRLAASKIFRIFPGRWEVRERADHHEAQAFWRAVIESETGGNFQQIELNDDRWRGPAQVFDIPD